MLLEARPAIRIEEVTTTEALDRLRPEWSALWARCAGATPFQSPEWLIPWWRQIGEGTLWALAVRHEGRLVGLAPLFIYTKPGSTLRELYLIGTGTTDYLEALFERGFERSGSAAIFAHLEGERHRWDVCDFQELRPGSPLLEAALPRGWADDIAVWEACPVLPLPSAVEELRDCIPPRLLQNLRYDWRRAERMGAVSVEAAAPGNLAELFDALLGLHRARWSSRGLSGVLADQGVRRAHRESLPDLLSLGALRLYGLRLEGRLIASYYGFMDIGALRKRAYYYLSGFDPEYERLSPGTMIIGHAIGEAIREGAVEFDFLRGREPYKYRWGAKDQPNYRRRLWHTGRENVRDAG
jgi:CelD/BcsL family acetyltransferase involved in cellulose biosynthesis